MPFRPMWVACRVHIILMSLLQTDRWPESDFSSGLSGKNLTRINLVYIPLITAGNCEDDWPQKKCKKCNAKKCKKDKKCKKNCKNTCKLCEDGGTSSEVNGI